MLSFHLSDDFISDYAAREPWWGYTDIAGNSLGEMAFVSAYSRRKEDGTKERWFEVCRRVIEGMYHEQKQWCLKTRLPWNDNKAQVSAREAYDRLWARKWAPPGRGLWVMGTEFVHDRHNSAALQNCAFTSTSTMTKTDPSRPFTWLMEASMLGVGVGWDALGADKGFKIHEPDPVKSWLYVVPDTREGWCESVKHVLESYLITGRGMVHFDYSLIRQAGEPIRGFGGTAAGPEPLMQLHNMLRYLLSNRDGEAFTSRDIADVMALEGKCVVAGNVRRSAEIGLFHADDKDALDLKIWEKNPERMDMKTGWGWTANHSVFATVGMDYEPILERAAANGEPGLAWMDVVHKYGRTGDVPDNKDWRAAGFNPCGEQPLESFEMCTLVNVYPTNCDDLADFLRTLKFAYLYAKTVTLIPTHWPDTNAVMQRNRRIGVSFNGAWEFSELRGYREMDKWMESGYETIGRWDRLYSEWLCVRESIRKTTLKPDGTGNLLTGTTPGAHASPGGEFYLRRKRYHKDDPDLIHLREAGYDIEPAFGSMETTVVVTFPIRSKIGVRSQAEASVYEKMYIAARLQEKWSDNAVSYTLTFDPETETNALAHTLRMFEGKLKSISFLPMTHGSYPQMPYETITEEEYESYRGRLKKIDSSRFYDGTGHIDAVGERFCTTDVCEVRI